MAVVFHLFGEELESEVSGMNMLSLDSILQAFIIAYNWACNQLGNVYGFSWA
jgi:hypothetical protein